MLGVVVLAFRVYFLWVLWCAVGFDFVWVWYNTSSYGFGGLVGVVLVLSFGFGLLLLVGMLVVCCVYLWWGLIACVAGVLVLIVVGILILLFVGSCGFL